MITRRASRQFLGKHEQVRAAPALQLNFFQHVFSILKQLATGRVRPSADTASPRLSFPTTSSEAAQAKRNFSLGVALAVVLSNDNVSNLRSTVLKFFDQIRNDPNHRYRSWEHCFGYFQRFRDKPKAFDLDTATLHLGFYLASWGMYRGSTFLLWKDYRIHAPAVSVLIDPAYRALWDTNAIPHNIEERVTLVVKLSTAITNAYKDNIRFVRGKQRQVSPTNTQITKTLLGTLACAPACDTYFRDGFRVAGLKYSEDMDRFLRRVYKFIAENETELRAVQQTVNKQSPTPYPTMKIVDMYFWQIGADLPKNQKARAKGE